MENLFLYEIKINALNNHIPIIMDDTLEYLNRILADTKLNSILEIGTAIRILCNLLF